MKSVITNAGMKVLHEARKSLKTETALSSYFSAAGLDVRVEDGGDRLVISAFNHVDMRRMYDVYGSLLSAYPELKDQLKKVPDSEFEYELNVSATRKQPDTKYDGPKVEEIGTCNGRSESGSVVNRIHEAAKALCVATEGNSNNWRKYLRVTEASINLMKAQAS